MDTTEDTRLGAGRGSTGPLSIPQHRSYTYRVVIFVESHHIPSVMPRRKKCVSAPSQLTLNRRLTERKNILLKYIYIYILLKSWMDSVGLTNDKK